MGDWDDIAVVAPAGVAADLGQWAVSGALAPTGLTMRPEKCQAWLPVPLSGEMRDAFPAGTRFAPPEAGLVWAGIPFGRDAFVVDTVRNIITVHLAPLTDPLHAFGLLSGPQQYSALNLSILARPGDLLRMVPPRLLADAAAFFDTAALHSFCSMINVPSAELSSTKQLQIELTVNGGGFGLRRKGSLLHAAYLSAFLSAQGIVQQKWGAQLGDIVRNIGTSDLPTALDVRQSYETVRAFDNGMPEAGRARRLLDNDEVLPAGLVNLPAASGKLSGLQHRLTELIDAVNRLRVSDESSAEERAWLESCSGSTAGAFLRNRPGIIAPSTRMTSREFAITCQRRLFIPLTELAHTSARDGHCPALPAAGGRRCPKPCDLRGTHLTSCATGGGSSAIHDVVNGALAIHGFGQVFPRHLILSQRADIRAALCQRLNLPFEAQLPFPVPDIMTLGEERLYVDTMLTDPRGAANMERGAADADGAGVSAEAATAKKLRDYAPAFNGGHLQPTQFKAFVMEHGGRLSKSADAVLHRLACLHEAKLTNLPPPVKLGPVGSRFLTLLRQILSATLHKATSSRILAVADRVLFTRASRAPHLDDYSDYSASSIAEAVGGFG